MIFDPHAVAALKRWLRLYGYYSPVHLANIDWRKHRRRGWKQRRSAGIAR